MITKDALKFFHAYIIEMIDIGGKNLPKSVSIKLGSKLGKIYKKRGILNFEAALNKSFKVMKGLPKINKQNNKAYFIDIKYRQKFCPIGGQYKPQRALTIQESLCIPFYLGFVNELNQDFTFKIKVNECIMNSKQNHCKFTLNLETKEKLNI